jgi:cobalt-zinc-cadmium efflux system membrane fusion protein
MRAKLWSQAAVLPLLALAMLGMAGCGGVSSKGPEAVQPESPASGTNCNVVENWCVEHGVPEDICGQCNAKVAADFQRNGDWCKEHNRPESQCFLCNPKLQAKFAAEYEVKYGKRPPAPKTE